MGMKQAQWPSKHKSQVVNKQNQSSVALIPFIKEISLRPSAGHTREAGGEWKTSQMECNLGVCVFLFTLNCIM